VVGRHGTLPPPPTGPHVTATAPGSADPGSRYAPRRAGTITHSRGGTGGADQDTHDTRDAGTRDAGNTRHAQDLLAATQSVADPRNPALTIKDHPVDTRAGRGHPDYVDS
jgi:hypothetical protein